MFNSNFRMLFYKNKQCVHLDLQCSSILKMVNSETGKMFVRCQREAYTLREKKELKAFVAKHKDQYNEKVELWQEKQLMTTDEKEVL